MEKEHVKVLAKIFLEAVNLQARAREASSKSRDITGVSFTENDVKVVCEGRTYHFLSDDFWEEE